MRDLLAESATDVWGLSPLTLALLAVGVSVMAIGLSWKLARQAASDLSVPVDLGGVSPYLIAYAAGGRPRAVLAALVRLRADGAVVLRADDRWALADPVRRLNLSPLEQAVVEAHRAPELSSQALLLSTTQPAIESLHQEAVRRGLIHPKSRYLRALLSAMAPVLVVMAVLVVGSLLSLLSQPQPVLGAQVAGTTLYQILAVVFVVDVLALAMVWNQVPTGNRAFEQQIATLRDHALAQPPGNGLHLAMGLAVMGVLFTDWLQEAQPDLSLLGADEEQRLAMSSNAAASGYTTGCAAGGCGGGSGGADGGSGGCSGGGGCGGGGGGCGGGS